MERGKGGGIPPEVLLPYRDGGVMVVFSGFQRTSFSDFPGKISSVVFTQGCNFRCPYCHNPELVGKSQGMGFSENEVLSYLKKRRRRITGLVVTGGEPTLHGDLADFLRKVKSLGIAIKLDTNGSRPGVLSELLAEGLVDYVAMDVKAPLHKYLMVSGSLTSPMLVKKSIDAIIASGVDHEFRTTAFKPMITPEDLIEIAELVQGCQRYVLQPCLSTRTLDVSLEKNPDLGFSNEELTALSMRMEDSALTASVR